MYSEKTADFPQKASTAGTGRSGADTRKPKYMTVADMGKILGLKKTDRYWLVKKGVFETRLMAGRICVDTASFEKWYAGQSHYRKVNGEKPGKELSGKFLSAADISRILSISENAAYDLIHTRKLETIVVDNRKRVAREVFDRWYESQDWYRKAEDRRQDAALAVRTVSIPEMARMLGVDRQTVHYILKKSKYKQYFKTVVIGGRKRILLDGLWQFLKEQDHYRLAEEGEPVIASGKAVKKTDLTRPGPDWITECVFGADEEERITKTMGELLAGSTAYLSQREAAKAAGVTETMISIWITKGYFPAKKVGNKVRIPKKEFIAWFACESKESRHNDPDRAGEGGKDSDGIDQKEK